jgi:fructose-1-phosphate kinase PfkB-like protein
VVSPIGCGDCLAAALAVALQQGQTVPDAVRLGVAAALDNLGQPLPAALDPKRIDRILPSITLETVTPPWG